MTELEQGVIKINGTDIKSVGLHNLRKGISIIPQIPFTFAGSIRKNLDPIGVIKDDTKIWEVLKLLELEGKVKGLA
jgi:ABC-type multidrug transport system fused ATPase/permease subunit